MKKEKQKVRDKTKTGKRKMPEIRKMREFQVRSSKKLGEEIKERIGEYKGGEKKRKK